MNKQRRKELASILNDLEDLRSRLEAVSEEEQEAFDNIPENLWGSERYEKAEEAVDALEEALSSIEDIADSLSEL